MGCMDLIGPLPQSSSEFRYILVILDSFSKFVFLSTPNFNVVFKRLQEEIFLLYGVPQYDICDNGVQFSIIAFKQLSKEYQAKILFNAFYHPQTKHTEWVIRVLKTKTCCYCNGTE